MKSLCLPFFVVVAGALHARDTIQYSVVSSGKLVPIVRIWFLAIIVIPDHPDNQIREGSPGI